MDDFNWRISMAEVTEPGPFSRFEGIDRHLTVLRGRLRLDFADRSVTLGPLDSLAFSGSEAVFGTPLEPVLDLNVMTRNGKVQARMRPVDGKTVLASHTAVLIDLSSLNAMLFEDLTGLIGAPPPSLLVEFR